MIVKLLVILTLCFKLWCIGDNIEIYHQYFILEYYLIKDSHAVNRKETINYKYFLIFLSIDFNELIL